MILLGAIMMFLYWLDKRITPTSVTPLSDEHLKTISILPLAKPNKSILKKVKIDSEKNEEISNRKTIDSETSLKSVDLQSMGSLGSLEVDNTSVPDEYADMPHLEGPIIE